MEGSMRRLAAVIALLAASACGGGEDPKPSASTGTNGGAGGGASGGTLVFARGGDSEHLYPAIVNDCESAKVITNIFDTLVGFEPGTLKLAPALADRWSASEDGRTWTFHLREAKFHDGTP